MKLFFSMAAAVLTLTACQTMPYQPYARDVKKKPQANGVIALKPEHRDEDRQKAQTMMASNCGNLPIKILEEGEVVIGQETTSTADTAHNQGSKGSAVNLFGIPMVSGARAASDTTNSKAATTQLKEWQISYECESATKKTR